jgi:hypothetical protein
MVDTSTYSTNKRHSSFYSCHAINHTSTLRRNSLSTAVKALCYSCAIFFLVACREHYLPPVAEIDSRYLVVEGFINAQGRTDIILTRTTRIIDTVTILREQGAIVAIIGEDNSIVPLLEDTAGHYRSDSVSLNKSLKYSLSIKTSDGKSYQSDFLAVKKTPPIDSVVWRNEFDGVNIYVNSHDDIKNSRYYKWSYDAVWEVHSRWGVLLPYVNGDISVTTSEEQNKLFYCWHHESPSIIILGSTASLADNVISMIPVFNIPLHSEPLAVRFSIVVKQIALDKPAYQFYQSMKKNTETTGSIFGPLPTELSTNIHCVSNPSEPVVGYMTVSTEEKSKRIFISNSDVPDWNYHSGCASILVDNDANVSQHFYNNVLIPYDVKRMGLAVLGYYASTRECMDCRTRGSNVKPSYW